MILIVNHKIDTGGDILRKLALIITFSAFLASNASAQMPYLEEVRALGAVAGQGLACGATKYSTFEMLARAILISKASSDKMQAEGMYKYNEEKANSYFSKQIDGFYECEAINNRFNSQDIFNATLYADGTIKMPDGNIVTPRHPYDATLIYDKKNQESIKAQEIYAGSGNEPAKGLQIKDSNELLPTQNQEGRIPAINAPAPVQELSEPAIKHIKRSY